VVATDLRGYGDSEKPPGGAAPEETYRELRDFFAAGELQ